MNKTITVEVTQDDINKGECGDTYKCAIALAVLRATGAARVSVCFTDAWVYRDEVSVKPDVYSFPGKVTEFIEAFDHSMPVEPFVFTVEYVGSV